MNCSKFWLAANILHCSLDIKSCSICPLHVNNFTKKADPLKMPKRKLSVSNIKIEGSIKSIPKICKNKTSKPLSDSEASSTEDENSENEETCDVKPILKKDLSIVSDNDEKEVEDETEITTGTLFYEDLDPDSEIWTVQCPEEGVRNLVESFVDIRNYNETCTTDSQFTIKPIHSMSDKSLVIPQRNSDQLKLLNLKFSGHVVVSKAIKPAPSSVEMKYRCIKSEIPIVPTNLKVRHPLLGLQWKKYIKETKKYLRDREKNDGKKILKHKKAKSSKSF